MSVTNGEIDTRMEEDGQSWLDQQPEEKEFTEKDVLPFLLQAQDIISKLESRVVELEYDLSTIYSKYEHDRKEWIVGLSQKDRYISHLSNKLSRTDFNTREAITLLSELLDENNMLINKDTEQVQSVIGLCLSYLRMQHSPNISSSVPHLDELCDKPSTITIKENHNNHATNIRSCDIVEEEELLPTSLNASFSTTTTVSSISSSLRHSVDQHMNTSSVYTESAFTLPSSNSIYTTTGTEEGLEEAASKSTRVKSSSSSASSSFCINCKQLLSQLDAQVEKQTFLKRDLDSLASALNAEEETRLLIEQDKAALEAEVEDITCSLFTYLNEMLMDEVNNREDLIQLNRVTKGGLEEVIDAWDVREKRLKQLKELLVQLDSTVHQSSNITSCSAARRVSYHQQHRLRTSISSISTAATRSSSSANSCNDNINMLLNSPLSSQSIRVDGVVLNEFKEHVSLLRESKNDIPISSTAFAKRIFSEDVEPCLFFNPTGNKQLTQKSWWWGSGWFKKRLLNAIMNNECEIQQYRSHPDRRHSRKHSSSTSSAKTIDASSLTTDCNDIKNTINLEEMHITDGYMQPTAVVESEKEQQQQLPTKFKCSCCNTLRVCEFKLKLPNHINNGSSNSSSNLKQQQQQTHPQEDCWLAIDRFCRDRIVAVCNYYNFMSHLKLLAFASNAPDLMFLFKQVQHLRRKMATARVGSVELFELEEREEEEKTKRLSMQAETLKRRSSLFAPTSATANSGGNGASAVNKRWTHQQQQRRRSYRHSNVYDLTGSSSSSDSSTASTTNLVTAFDNVQFVIVS